MLLYAPGDNEINDCHRLVSGKDTVAAAFYRAQHARNFIVNDLNLRNRQTDLRGKDKVLSHKMHQYRIPGSRRLVRCDFFDKYIERDDFAAATFEVIGSHYYQGDERNKKYPHQNSVDPLGQRLSMFVNANLCSLEWIADTARRAHSSGKRALFFMMHASFYSANGKSVKGNDGIGDFYSPQRLGEITSEH